MSEAVQDSSAQSRAGKSQAAQAVSKTTTLGDIARLLPYLSTEKGPLAWTVIVDLLANLALIGLSVATAHIVGTAVLTGQLDAPGWWIVAATLAVLRPVLTWHEMDVSHSVAYRVLAALRIRLFDGFARGIPSPRGVHSGHMAATTMTDVEKLEFFYAHTVAQLVSAGALLVITVPVLTALSPALGAVFVGGCALLIAFALPLMRRGERLGVEQQTKTAELSEKTVDVLAGTREILVFTKTAVAVADLAAQGDALDASSRKVRELNALGALVRESVVVLTSLALALTAYSVRGLNPVWVPCLLAGSLTLLAPLAEAVAVIATLQPHRSSARRVAEGIELSTGVGAARHPAVYSLPGDAAELAVFTHKAQFAYPGRDALQIPDLRIYPGEHVGIAGPSGVGKSTLARLLTGLWQPTSGTVVVAGRPVSDYSADELPSVVQLVEQDTPLFHGTLAENLRMGCPQASDKQLARVLQLVQLELNGVPAEQCLSVSVGEEGSTLSGGQKARICLARALVMNPEVLVLDETTAALDAQAESAVMDVVATLDCTVLVISHREQTLARTDRVVRWLDADFASEKTEIRS